MTQLDPNNQRRTVIVLGFSLLALALIARVVLATGPARPNAAVQIIPSIAISKLPDTQEIIKGGTATFTIEVTNNGLANLQNVTVTDSLAPDCDRTIGPLNMGESDSYICTRPNVTESFLNEAVASGETNLGLQASDSDAAVVEILDLDVNLVANPISLPEPGGVVLFTVTVTNSSSVDVTLTSLNSNRYGELTDDGNNSVENNDCDESPIPAGGGQYTCSFEATFSEQPGAYQVTLTATAENVIPVTANDSTTVNITPPPISFLYLPVTLDTNDEPNDSCGQAFPITIDKDFYFLANDFQDWYWFDLPQATSNLVVELSNFVPVAGQMIVYASGAGECSSLQFLQSNGDFSSTKIVSLGQRAPGRYYVRVINDGPYNSKDFYKLRVSAP